MKFDLKKVITDLDGKPHKFLKDEKTKDTMELTIGKILVEAAQMPFKDGSDGEEKISRWKLALRLHKQDEAELSLEEINTLLPLVKKRYPMPIIYDQVVDHLESAKTEGTSK